MDSREFYTEASIEEIDMRMRELGFEGMPIRQLPDKVLGVLKKIEAEGAIVQINVVAYRREEREFNLFPIDTPLYEGMPEYVKRLLPKFSYRVKTEDVADELYRAVLDALGGMELKP